MSPYIEEKTLKECHTLGAKFDPPYGGGGQDRKKKPGAEGTVKIFCNCRAGCTFRVLVTRIVKHEHCTLFPHHCSPSVSPQFRCWSRIAHRCRCLSGGFFSPFPAGACPICPPHFWRGSNYGWVVVLFFSVGRGGDFGPLPPPF